MALQVDEKSLKQGVLSLVVTLAEVIEETLTRQALRRMDSGDLTEAELDRLGDGLRDLEEALEQIKIADDDDADAASRLAGWLTANAQSLGAKLEQLEGRYELKVEVRLQVDSVQGSALDELEGRNASASSGMRLLLEKKREQLRRTIAAERADALHAQLREALCAQAVDVQTLKLSRVGPGEAGVLALALLVDSARVEEVGRVLARFQSAQPGLVIAFLGPWPPFHFAELQPVVPTSPP